MNLPAIVKKFLETYDKPRYRDRRGHYASSAMKCLRDQYWKATGEKATNKSDLQSLMNMSIGNWIEEGFVKTIISKLHLFNVHLVDTQVSVGGSKPDWDGYVDILISERVGGKLRKPLVVELKTKHGYGADLLTREFDPSIDYEVQLGLYLKALHSKGVTSDGMLYYILLSDKNFGTMLAFNARYLPATDEIQFYEVCSAVQESQAIDIRVKVGENSLSRWRELEAAIKDKKCPAPDYHYKRALTPEFLSTVSDNQLKQAIAGEKILGDWQPRYSEYFDKILETDKTPREYTEKELSLLRNELESRKTGKRIEAKAKRAAKKAEATGTEEEADPITPLLFPAPTVPSEKKVKSKKPATILPLDAKQEIESKKKQRLTATAAQAKVKKQTVTRPEEVDADEDEMASIQPREALSR